MVVNGIAGGSSVVTASVAGLSASCTVTCATPSSLAFRGYWVSPGILYRDANGNYGLTNVRDGDNFNPFELYDYFNHSESLNTYYFKWFNLRTELGADGNNIDADSDKLPAGWMFPTGTNSSSGIWNTIFNGVPKTEIKIGNTVLGTSPYDSSRPMPWAKVTVTVGDKSYYGVILLRDGAVVDFNLNTLGKSSAYSDNILSYTDLQKFLDERCLFISCSGYYNDVTNSLKGWKNLKGSSYEIDYWSSTYINDTKAGYYLATSLLNGAATSSSGSTYCMPVRLVKPATDMNP